MPSSGRDLRMEAAGGHAFRSEAPRPAPNPSLPLAAAGGGADIDEVERYSLFDIFSIAVAAQLVVSSPFAAVAETSCASFVLGVMALMLDGPLL